MNPILAERIAEADRILAAMMEGRDKGTEDALDALAARLAHVLDGPDMDLRVKRVLERLVLCVQSRMDAHVLARLKDNQGPRYGAAVAGYRLANLVCVDCSKRFTSAHGLLVHRKKMHAAERMTA